MPDVTPSGKPANVGVVVATPAAAGGATQQWMCDAVVPAPAVSPVKTTVTWSWCVTVSSDTIVEPVPGDAFTGNSLGPFNSAL